MKVKYLLDTTVLVDILRGPSPALVDKIKTIGFDSFAIADMTLYELLCGAEISTNRIRNVQSVSRLARTLTILPSSEAYYTAASERKSLRDNGNLIEDFDLLIASVAKYNHLILVSSNPRHMNRISGLEVQDWRN